MLIPKSSITNKPCDTLVLPISITTDAPSCRSPYRIGEKDHAGRAQASLGTAIGINRQVLDEAGTNFLVDRLRMRQDISAFLSRQNQPIQQFDKTYKHLHWARFLGNYGTLSSLETNKGRRLKRANDHSLNLAWKYDTQYLKPLPSCFVQYHCTARRPSSPVRYHLVVVGVHHYSYIASFLSVSFSVRKRPQIEV